MWAWAISAKWHLPRRTGWLGTLIFPLLGLRLTHDIKSRFICNHFVLLQFLWVTPSPLFIDFTHITLLISAKPNSTHPWWPSIGLLTTEFFSPSRLLISVETQVLFSYHLFDPYHEMLSEIFSFFCTWNLAYWVFIYLSLASYIKLLMLWLPKSISVQTVIHHVCSLHPFGL